MRMRRATPSGLLIIAMSQLPKRELATTFRLNEYRKQFTIHTENGKL
jgi:hypothetical protein